MVKQVYPSTSSADQVGRVELPPLEYHNRRAAAFKQGRIEFPASKFPDSKWLKVKPDTDPERIYRHLRRAWKVCAVYFVKDCW